MTKAAILDTSVQKTHEWLHEIGSELGFDNERAAYAALRATLHAVRDRLPAELVAHFGAELPTFIRGIYYEGWHPSAVTLKAAHKTDFCEFVREKLEGHDELQHVDQVVQSSSARSRPSDRTRTDRPCRRCPPREGASALAGCPLGQKPCGDVILGCPEKHQWSALSRQSTAPALRSKA